MNLGFKLLNLLGKLGDCGVAVYYCRLFFLQLLLQRLMLGPQLHVLPSQGIQLIGRFAHLLLSGLELEIDGIELGNGGIELGSEFSDFLVDCDDLVLILNCFLLELTRYLSAVLLQLNVVRFKLSQFFIEVLELGLFLVDVVF